LLPDDPPERLDRARLLLERERGSDCVRERGCSVRVCGLRDRSVRDDRERGDSA